MHKQRRWCNQEQRLVFKRVSLGLAVRLTLLAPGLFSAHHQQQHKRQKQGIS